MRLTDLNAEGGIGANLLLIEIGSFRLIFDAGLHPKKFGRDALPQFKKVDDFSVDFLVLTHSHLDHVGSLPVFLRRQPQAKIIASLPTQMLAPRMLHNSCNVMKRQRDEHGIQEYPLYHHAEVERLKSSFLPLPFNRPRHLQNDRNDEIQITLYPSGHIPGACGCLLSYKHRRIFFTGDVLFSDQKILPAARFPDLKVDTLVMETTRGATERTKDRSRSVEVRRLLETIDNTLSHGGSCLIPTFALGRMQELISIFHEARSSQQLRDVPIYCSGLGMDLVNYFDEIARKMGLVRFRRSLLRDLKVQPLPLALAPGKPPKQSAIYLLSSGMMVEQTPSYLVASALLAEPGNTICFVGYCDPDTPGGRLLVTEPGDEFIFEALNFACRVRAHVEQFDLSSHADRDELLEFALAANPRAVVLTHGDPAARAWFFKQLNSRQGISQVLDPKPLETYLV